MLSESHLKIKPFQSSKSQT